MPKSINILLIEDNPGDVRLVHELFRDSPDLLINLIIAKTLEEGAKALATKIIHIVLLDLNLPDSSGLNTFIKIKKYARDLPIIIMSILEDKEVIYQAMQQGAQNYLIKGKMEFETLEQAIRYALWNHSIIT